MTIEAICKDCGKPIEPYAMEIGAEPTMQMRYFGRAGPFHIWCGSPEFAASFSRDDEAVAVPRWVLNVLAGELAGHTVCGGKHDEPGCPICDAIRIATRA